MERQDLTALRNLFDQAVSMRDGPAIEDDATHTVRIARLGFARTAQERE